MKIFLTIIFCLVTINSQAQQQVDKLNMVVQNICEFYGQYVISNSTDSNSQSAALGNARCVYNSLYTHYDSLETLGKVRFLEVSHESPKPEDNKLFYVANESEILSYYSSFPTWTCDPVIVPHDTLTTDSIAGMMAYHNLLMVIRNTIATDNLLFFDTLSAAPYLTINTGMCPLLFTYNSDITVVGLDSTNSVRVKIFDYPSLNTLHDTVLGSMADNPIAVSFNYPYKVGVVSQPGDSCITVNWVNFQNNSITYTTIYSGSGAHTSAWSFGYFVFQPETDPSGNNYTTQILRFDLFTMQSLAPVNTNIRYHKLINANNDDGMGYYPFLHGVVEDTLNNKVIIYDNFNYTIVDSFTTDNQVDHVQSDFRCPVGLEEYDDSKVKIAAHPNPTNNSIRISAEGLICGRDYKMDIVNNNGRIMIEKTIHAKMSFEIPLESYPSGIYFLRIHTRKGMVAEKIVKL